MSFMMSPMNGNNQMSFYFYRTYIYYFDLIGRCGLFMDVGKKLFKYVKLLSFVSRSLSNLYVNTLI